MFPFARMTPALVLALAALWCGARAGVVPARGASLAPAGASLDRGERAGDRDEQPACAGWTAIDGEVPDDGWSCEAPTVLPAAPVLLVPTALRLNPPPRPSESRSPRFLVLRRLRC